jgi:acylglycerol lipase
MFRALFSISLSLCVGLCLAAGSTLSAIAADSKTPSASAGEDALSESGMKDMSSAVKPKSTRPTAPTLRWTDDPSTAKAVILCVHGLGLHNASYAGFGKRMAKLGFIVYAVDMRGFGSYKDVEGKEHVDFDGCMSDIKATLRVLHRAHAGLPVYLLGESMGGAIVMHATAAFPELVDGTVSSVPAGTRFKQSTSTMKVALHALEGGLNKEFDVGSGVIKQATEKQDLREAWGNDPLNRLNLSPRELMLFQNFMDHNHDVAPLIKTTPVLMVQGCKDKLVKPEGTVELFNELGTSDRRIQLVQNGEHLIFEENQASDAALDSLTNWLDLHILAYQAKQKSASAP